MTSNSGNKPVRIPKPAPVCDYQGWPRLEPARLTWGDSVPCSDAFGDIYFSREDGLEETRHVFLHGIGAPEIWQDRKRFVVGETGFGTGLNFLACWDLWQKTAPAEARLDFVTVEAFPVTVSDMEKAHAIFPELAPLAAQLRAACPVLIPGYHRISLQGGRVNLLLMFGEAAEMYESLEAKIDAWYLDGFAPALNSALWSDRVLDQIERLSVPGARLATFTVAGAVRRGLVERGFTVEKTPGYGRKRQCLQAVWQGKPARRGPFVPARDRKPSWMHMGDALEPGSQIAVIGAGIAGASAARALAERGFRPLVLDRHAEPGGEGSGNASALMDPRTDLDPGQEGRLHIAAFEDALRHYQKLEAESGDSLWHLPRGLLRFPEAGEEADKLALIASHGPWAGEPVAAGQDPAARMLTPAEAAEKAGLAEESQAAAGGALWLSRAGCLNPAATLRALLRDIDCRFECEIEAIEPLAQGAGWRLRIRGGEVVEVPALVLACGFETVRFLPEADLPVRPRRGQATILLDQAEPGGEGKGESLGGEFALSFGNYLTGPFWQKTAGGDRLCRVLGATHTHWPEERGPEGRGPEEKEPRRLVPGWDQPDDREDARNLEGLAAFDPDLASRAGQRILASRASMRATLPDQTPLLGPVAPPAVLDSWLRPHFTRRAERPDWLPRLAVLAGLGSRGFQTSSLLAALMAAQWSGAPWPLPRELAELTSPARFALRRKRKGG